MFLTSWLFRAGRAARSPHTVLRLESLDERNLPSNAAGIFAVGADLGGQPEVHVYNADGSLRDSFLAYDAAFTGGVRVAVADVTGDGVPDVITAAGPGGGPHVKVFDGATGTEVLGFFAYDPTDTKGVSIAAGEINGQGVIVTGTGPGGPPLVKIFDGVTGDLKQMYVPYDITFNGGVNVAVADVMGNGHGSVITAPGAGMAPEIKVFDGLTEAVEQDFMAYDPGFDGGVSVAAGDVTGLGRAEIITGAGPGGGPHVKVFDAPTATALQSFFAYDATFTGGVVVAVTPGIPADLVTGAGPGGGPHLKVFDGRTGATVQSLFAFPPTSTTGLALGTGYGLAPPNPPVVDTTTDQTTTTDYVTETNDYINQIYADQAAADSYTAQITADQQTTDDYINQIYQDQQDFNDYMQQLDDTQNYINQIYADQAALNDYLNSISASP